MSYLEDTVNVKEYRERRNKFTVEADRIKSILDDTVRKLQFAMTIPIIIDNHRQDIEQIFSDTEMYFVKKAFCKYTNVKSDWELKNTEERNDFLSFRSSEELETFFNNYKPENTTIPKKDEYDISKAIQIFYEKEEILKLAYTYQDKISQGANTFLKNISYLFTSSSQEMKISPEEAIKNEENLRNFFNRHSVLSDYCNFSRETHEDQFNRDIGYFDQRLKELNTWESAVQSMKEQARLYIEKMLLETDEILMYDIKSGEEKKEALLAQIDTDIGDLKTQRKKNVEEERELRIKRYKTEQQLVNALKLYDRDMTERHNIYDDKKAALEEEKAVLRDFLVKYDHQTKVYSRLMAEKKEYEDRLIEGRLYELRCKMAARKIQRFFRRYLAVAGMSKSTELRKSQKKLKAKTK